MFDTFALVKHPHIDSDIFVSDEENPRIIVECLGAAADDGVVLLLRHMRTTPAPKRNTLERHIQRAPLDINMEDGYQTLADLISSDGETSEVAGEWA
ncbi:hypothetical protein H4S01_003121 [Coemansia sp. RSA 2610]|nr:hypothetical protein H4S01_003121 [Coemansia sp. RSA 2610]